MARLRRKDRRAVEETTDEAPPAVESTDPRRDGPWDSSERSTKDDESYVDLGALVVQGHPDLQIQLPTDDEDGTIGSVVMMTDDAALEVRAFAAAKSGGTWSEILDDLEAEVQRMGGEHESVDGPFGRELHVRVPVQLPDGEEGFQPSRIVGVEGPRWLLRATFLGQAALEPSDEGLLMDALRAIVVVRGNEARIAREPLLLTLPEGAVLTQDEE